MVLRRRSPSWTARRRSTTTVHALSTRTRPYTDGRPDGSTIIIIFHCFAFALHCDLELSSRDAGPCTYAVRSAGLAQSRTAHNNYRNTILYCFTSSARRSNLTVQLIFARRNLAVVGIHTYYSECLIVASVVISRSPVYCSYTYSNIWLIISVIQS